MKQLTIYYDKECPVCSRYISYVSLKETYSSVKLINVRENQSLFNKFKLQGFDLDKGMIADVDGKIYYGAEAISLIAQSNTKPGLLSVINNTLFSKLQISKTLYPILVSLRNLLLIILGKGKIASSFKPDCKRDSFNNFHLFSWLWSFSTLFHFTYLAFYKGTYQHGPITLSWIYLALATWIILNPTSKKVMAVFLTMISIQTIEMWQQMPTISSHAILLLFLMVTLLLTGFYTLFKRGYDTKSYYNSFAPSGRWILVIMYTFGIFHKINTDFLNPASSCASALWASLPFPNLITQSTTLHYLAIYSTFIIEGLVLIALFSKNYRRYAILLGCFFHLFIMLSPFAYYGAFSFLSLTLHSLFLGKESLENLKNSKLAGLISRNTHQIQTSMLLYILVTVAIAFNKDITPLTFMAALLSLFVFGCIILYGQRQYLEPNHPLKANAFTYAVALTFFINCAMPYAGLKTHQAMSMFSNLHLEGNRSNHLLIDASAQKFDYLKETVRITRIQKNDKLLNIPKFDIVYHDLLAHMKDDPERYYSYIKDDKFYKDISYSKIKTEVNKTVLPAFIRKVFFFTGVDYSQPKSCVGFSENVKTIKN